MHMHMHTHLEAKRRVEGTGQGQVNAAVVVANSHARELQCSLTGTAAGCPAQSTYAFKRRARDTRQGTHGGQVDAVVHVAEGDVEGPEGQHHALALLAALQHLPLRRLARASAPP